MGNAKVENQTKNLLTLEEIAGELRVSRTTAQRLVRGELAGSPRLAAVRIGRRYMVRRESLDRYMTACEQIEVIA